MEVGLEPFDPNVVLKELLGYTVYLSYNKTTNATNGSS
jgi:hypothetical protein